MSKKGKGTNGTRSRNQRKDAKEEPVKSNTDEVLQEDFYVQRATQNVTNRYEKLLLEQKNNHQKEMENFLEGQKYWVKPSLWARITGRYKDMYLVRNHMQPFHCTDCGSNHHGVNFGIEALTLDLETALTHIDELLDKYPTGKARLLHIQIDRRSRRHGQIVNDYTFLMKDWSADRRKYITDEISSNSAAGKIFGSLQEDTKQYIEGKRRSKREMP